MINLNNTDRAIYLQIADDIADRIAAGEFGPGQRVPSVREYAATVMVNVNTVVRSYEQLAAQGIIFNRRGMGYFVADDAPERIAAERRSIFLAVELQQTFRRLKALGYTPAQLADAYTNFLEQKQ
ncbi:MAG: GntR family transcriptional regulator [Muribaculaceae bacterium]|nr:GntR family transcriptional regulator [Muribaculaceae bacterium]